MPAMPDDAHSMQLVPTAPNAVAALAGSAGGWGDGGTLAPIRPPLERPLAAIRRYKFLCLAVLALAMVGGGALTQFIKPQYEVRATIWIASQTPISDKNGPIRSHELLNPEAWVELLRSFRIADAVVRKLNLYVKAESDADSVAFSSFGVADRFIPGKYELDTDKRGHWRLTLENAPVGDSGMVSDSIGRAMGLRWQLPRTALKRVTGRKISFTVSTPRETAVEMMARLSARLPERSNFLWLLFQDEDPQLAARTMNTWIREYVTVAGDLKKRNMVEFSNILTGQLDFAEASLHGAEASLENFRVHTITLPAEGGVAAGVEMSRDPALKAFFEKKIEYDNLRHDREALEKVMASAGSGNTPYEGALLIPSVAQSPGGESLRELFKQLYQRQAELNAARQVYTDQYPAVRELLGTVNTLRTRTIPQEMSQLLSQLRGRESEYDQRITSASQELQAIPTRTIEEMRLRRAVTVAEGLYSTLKSRAAEAKLAEAGAQPDVNILDSAVAPLRPTKNTAPRIMALATLGGLAAAIALALLLDALDKRMRYPEQATNELGLSIAGTVPVIPRGGINEQSPEQVTQLIESFRTLRMNVMNSSDGPVSVAVSSPSPGDGKSFVSANLAMSFADAGFRTLLVDGDTRRGALHEMFGLPRNPGLTDYLSGDATTSSIVHATSHQHLFVLPNGSPRRRSPELLTSPVLQQVIADLRQSYDVLVFDTPPFAAGIDGYAIAAAAGNLLVVLRIGQTERRMAAAKLLLLDRLPIRVLGAVLNAAPMRGEYAYYGYLEGYAAVDEEPASAIA